MSRGIYIRTMIGGTYRVKLMNDFTPDRYTPDELDMIFSDGVVYTMALDAMVYAESLEKEFINEGISIDEGVIMV